MRKSIKILLTLLVLVAVVFVGGRWLAFWQIEKTLVASIAKLRATGVMLRYEGLDVNPWAGNITVTGISAKWPGKDSLCHSTAVIPELSVEGIHLLPLLIKRKLVVNAIAASGPQITYSKHPEQTPSGTSDPGFLKGIDIRLVQVDSGMLTMTNNGCDTSFTATLNGTISQLQLWGLRGDSLRWKVASSEAKSIEVLLPAAFYRFKVDRFIFSGDQQSVGIDSIKIIPTLDPLAFAQQTGHQIDRIACTIPHIGMSGVNISEALPVALTIAKVDLGFILQVYRDMRFPKVLRRPRILPAKFMQQLPLSLRIDSLKLSGSSIDYAEMPETGGTPGSLRFSKINGSIWNITTDSIGESVMQISARFMDDGQLDSHFTFPMAPGGQNTVRATLSDFSMPAINSMLKPIANLEIESGHLQALRFSFQYDDQISIGELDLRYTDLNLRSIKKNLERSTNHTITLLLNTMVQNNMDRSDKKAKRSGAISWKRDPQAGLPNHWWKSILSGLRSVYSLENVLSI